MHCLYFFIIHILSNIMFINVLIQQLLNTWRESINHVDNHYTVFWLFNKSGLFLGIIKAYINI